MKEIAGALSNIWGRPSVSRTEVAPKIGSTPLLMIAAARDKFTLTDLASNTYEQTLQSSKLVLLQGGHFVPYVDKFKEASEAPEYWFIRHI